MYLGRKRKYIPSRRYFDELKIPSRRDFSILIYKSMLELERDLPKGGVQMRFEVASVILAGVLAVGALGQSNATSGALSGVWVSSSDSAMKLTLDAKDNQIHFQETNGGKLVIDYTCPTSGQECQAKEDGHTEKVMVYFNGPKLVELTERGSEVDKRRFELSPDGNTMQLEIIPLSSSGKTETMKFQRETPASSKSNS
jgi:hypothetical protein